jgi:phytol kinase
MQAVLGSICALLAFIALLGLLGMVRNRIGLSEISCRKIVHAGMGIICLTFPVFITTAGEVVFITVLFAAALLFLQSKPLLFSGSGYWFRAGRADSLGEYFYLAGISLTLLLAGNDFPLYSAAVATLAFADPVAAFAGGKKGRHRFRNGKSIEGSAAFFCVAAVCVFFAAKIDLEPAGIAVALLACLTATAVEAITTKGADNLCIPVCICAILSLKKISFNFANTLTSIGF